MNKRNLRNNQVLVNKLNQKLYRYEDGIGTEVLTDDQKEAGVTPDVVEINGDNIVCFSVSEDPNYDDYTMDEDGVLYANGTPVATGAIKVVKILVSGKRKALLAVQPLDEEAKGFDVFTYNAAIDSFKKMAGNVVLGNEITSGDAVIFPYENIREEEREIRKEDGTIEKQPYKVLEKAGFVEFNKETCYGAVYPIDSPLGELVKVADGYNGSIATLVFASKYNIIGNSDEDYDDEYDEYDEDSEEENDNTVNGELEELDGKLVCRVISVLESGQLRTGYAAFRLGNKIESATRAGRDLTLITDKAAYLGDFVLTDKVALKLITGYPFLVKNTYDAKKGERTISMATKDYKVKSILMKETTDRGIIVEEI